VYKFYRKIEQEVFTKLKLINKNKLTSLQRRLVIDFAELQKHCGTFSRTTIQSSNDGYESIKAILISEFQYPF